MDESRWLDSQAMAQYARVRADRLRRLMNAGKIPQANYSLGPRSPRWDREQVDAMFSGVAASQGRSMVDDALKASEEYAKKCRAQARAKRPGRPV